MGRIIAALLLAVTVEALASVTVTLTAPPDGSIYTSPANITLSADASAGQNYTVSEVQFYYGTTFIGNDFSAPYSITWTNAAVGQHSLTAKAIAVKNGFVNQIATSAPRSITVNAPPNAPPSAEITSPVNDSTYPIPTPTVTVSTTVSDIDGTIATVEFYNCAGGGEIAIFTNPPSTFTFEWTLPEPYWYPQKYREYAVGANVWDNLGSYGFSGCKRFLLVPTTTITSPANGANYAAPATIPLEVTLTPLAQTSANFTTVQFYHGTTLIGEKTAPPFTFTWQNVPEGSYSISAKMLFAGYVWWSAPINVTVGAAQAQLYFVHVDHLNTPRLVADATGTTVWRWDQAEPFGVNVPNENPSGLGAFDLPLRLPGQYFDKETNLHYNYLRDYDPSTGRYGESDPTGLDGGINTYTYVAGNPLFRVDPTGELFFIPALIAIASSGGGATAATAIGATAVVGGLIYTQSQSSGSKNSSVDPLTGTSSGAGTGSSCPPDDPCKGLRRQLEEHEDKLRRYQNDPYANDPKGFLGQGRDPQVIAGRIRNLQRQIANFRKLLEECERKNGIRN